MENLKEYISSSAHPLQKLSITEKTLNIGIRPAKYILPHYNHLLTFVKTERCTSTDGNHPKIDRGASNAFSTN
jgi:hypothetical protein